MPMGLGRLPLVTGYPCGPARDLGAKQGSLVVKQDRVLGITVGLCASPLEHLRAIMHGQPSATHTHTRLFVVFSLCVPQSSPGFSHRPDRSPRPPASAIAPLVPDLPTRHAAVGTFCW